MEESSSSFFKSEGILRTNCRRKPLRSNDLELWDLESEDIDERYYLFDGGRLIGLPTGASRVFPCSHGAKGILRSENLLRGKPELAVGFYFWDALLTETSVVWSTANLNDCGTIRSSILNRCLIYYFWNSYPWGRWLLVQPLDYPGLDSGDSYMVM